MHLINKKLDYKIWLSLNFLVPVEKWYKWGYTGDNII